MKAIYKLFTYICPNCKLLQKHHTWDKDVNKTTHVCDKGGCGTILNGSNLAPEKKKKQLVGIRTPTRNRV